MRLHARRGWTSLPLALQLLGGAVVATGAYEVFDRLRDFSSVGMGPNDSCAPATVDATRARCLGTPPTEFGDDGAIRQWIGSLRWTAGQPQARKAYDRLDPSKTGEKLLTIAAIEDARRVPLRELTRGSLVVARISGATDDGMVDALYGIGGERTDSLNSEFFVVLSPYQNPGRFRKVASGDRMTIMNWTLWGTRKSDGSLKQVTSGELKWCRHSHQMATGTLSAEFIRCSEQPAQARLQRDVTGNGRLRTAEFASLSQALDSVSVLSLARREAALPSEKRLGLAQLLTSDQYTLVEATITRSAFTSAGWISCGIGCCSIEPD